MYLIALIFVIAAVALLFFHHINNKRKERIEDRREASRENFTKLLEALSKKEKPSAGDDSSPE